MTPTVKPASRPSLVVFGTGGYVQAPSRFDAPTVLQALGWNAGNLVFQYAVSQFFDATYRYVGLSGMSYSDPHAYRGARYLVFPAANHFRMGTDWSHLSDALDQANLPIIVLGLGAQADSAGDVLNTIAALKADKSVRKLADVLNDKAVFISVRGEFSKKVCHELGLKNTRVLGCPSAMINATPDLGREINEKIELFAKADGERKFGLAAAAPFEIIKNKTKHDLERQLFRWAYNHNGAYIQQSGGDVVFQMCTGGAGEIDADNKQNLRDILAPDIEMDRFWRYMEENAHLFIDAKKWIAALKPLDMVIGARIHGAMAALAAGVPGVLAAHDLRTSELAQTMHIPTIDINDAISSPSLHEAVKSVAFSPKKFDSWRRNTAKEYLSALNKLGLAPAANLVRIGAGEAPD